MKYSFFTPDRGACQNKDRTKGRGNKNSRTKMQRRALQIEQMEPRAMMSGTPLTGGLGVIELFPAPTAAIEHQLVAATNSTGVAGVSNTPLGAFDTILKLGLLKSGSLVATTEASLQANIDSSLPSGMSAENVSVTFPAIGVGNSTAVDTTILSDGSVELDFIVNDVTGSLTVHVPTGWKFAEGAAVGAAAGGTWAGLGGSIVGAAATGAAFAAMSDPTFSFSTDIVMQVILPPPGQFTDLPAYGASSGSTDSSTMTATNLQVHGTNALGDVNKVLTDIFSPIKSTRDITYTNGAIAPALTGLEGYATTLLSDVSTQLTQLNKLGFTIVQTMPRMLNGQLDWVVEQPALPAGMVLSNPKATSTGEAYTLTVTGDQSSNLNDNITVTTWNNNSVDGGTDPRFSQCLEVQLNNHTYYFAPNTIDAINIDPGAGKNTVQIDALPAGIALSVNGGLNSNDTVTIGQNGSSLVGPNGVAGSVNVNYNSIPHTLTSKEPSVTLVVNDSADTAGETWTVTNQSVAVGSVKVAYSGDIAALNVLGGSGNDTVYVPSTVVGIALTIDAGGGNNQVVVGASAVPTLATANGSVTGIGGPVNVKDTAGKTSLYIDDAEDPNSRTFSISKSNVVFTGGPTITYQGSTTPTGNGVDSLTIADARVGENNFSVSSFAPTDVKGYIFANDGKLADRYSGLWAELDFSFYQQLSQAGPKPGGTDGQNEGNGLYGDSNK